MTSEWRHFVPISVQKNGAEIDVKITVLKVETIGFRSKMYIQSVYQTSTYEFGLFWVFWNSGETF